MNKKIVIFIISLISIFAFIGCSKTMETTTFFSMIVNSSDYYIRLQDDGKYYNNSGSSGTYSIDDDTVTFTDEVGGTTYGYLYKDNYLFYDSYSSEESKIPETDTFDIVLSDGVRTTMTFKSSGKMERLIKEENLYNFQTIGTYERKGDLIVCSFENGAGETYTQTFGVREGVLYDVLSCSDDDFTKEQIASMDSLRLKDKKPPINYFMVGFIVIVLLIGIGAIVYIFIVVSKPAPKDESEKNTKKK